MGGIVFKMFGIAALAVIVVYLLASAFRQSRRLNRRIAQHKREQEELAKQGKREDPYAALAELYAERDRKDRRRRTGRR
ncbi:MAG TPA: hypothetical protein VKT77_14060 [Chthonomonadaceae bacterium]|nr:hypothetical protein [Chthonomonadaceae bacterium]